MFLQGAAGTLVAIPLLPSLLGRTLRAAAQAAESPPVRYVQWVTDHGQFETNFWPKANYLPTEPAAPADPAAAGVKSRALSTIEGPLSPVLGAGFDSLRAKLNVVRGLDLMVIKGLHNACVPTCASWPREDNHTPFFSYSVDAILEKSKKMYPAPSRMPALRLTPGVNSAYKWGSFSWTTLNGKPFKLPCYDSTAAALAAVFPSTVNGGVDPKLAPRLRLTDQVLADYQRVAGLSTIGSADKQQLVQYMDLLADVQNRMKVQAPSCTPPGQLTQSDFDVLHKNASDITVAALLCGATRVVAYHCYQGAPGQYDEETFHNWAHNDAVKHGAMMVWRYKQLATLLSKMDQVVEGNGKTLLDNSLVYASNELSDPGHGNKHLQNMPIVLAGSAGGRVVTGQYVDFNKRLLNNLLVSIFGVMGLAPADYERNGVQGFGDYEGNAAAQYAPYLTAAERRKPLPVIFRA